MNILPQTYVLAGETMSPLLLDDNRTPCENVMRKEPACGCRRGLKRRNIPW
jgi:hypothetical protein